ncbi:MAG: hypothetical protein CMO40_06950 [Verrucomicrobiaceae bacterium]|nr:hypothetical protein [Verrucomicrobiaceae bacterium]
MSRDDLQSLKAGVAEWRLKLATCIEGKVAQRFIVTVILVNAVVLGLETDAELMEGLGPLLHGLDLVCLLIFVVEILVKLVAYRIRFWCSGWNVFDFVVVAIALLPGAGPLAVLRVLRVFRLLRLLTVLPQLRRVVAAFLKAIPGLGGVMTVMAVFFYVAAVLTTSLFADDFPDWFGSIGKSLYSLFQIMTLESWSMGIVRPVMEVHPWAWLVFVPFIVIATFTILNLFIGVIVSTMQELSLLPESDDQDTLLILARIEEDLAALRQQVEKGK